eukprot:757175-Hanusia_phi.AAC.9
MQTSSDPSFTDDLVAAAPVELPINYYYSDARCGRPCCDCYSDLSRWMEDEPGEAKKSPEAEIAEHYSIPNENVKRYRTAFDSFSKKRGGKILTRDTNGRIKVDDLQQLVKILGSNPSAQQLQYSIEQEELPQGGLDYPAFLTVMARHAPAWPVLISEAMRLPYSRENVLASSDLRRKIVASIAAAARVPSDQVELVRVREIPGHEQDECAIDFSVDAKSDDAETIKDMLLPAKINEMLPRFGLKESTSPVAVYDKIVLPLPMAQVDDEVQQKVLRTLAAVTGVDITQISLNKVVPDPDDEQQTKLVFYIEADTQEVPEIESKLRKDQINEELVREGLPTTETLMHPKIQPHPNYMSFLGPGCARCANSPYMDGDNLGKDWIGNFPFDVPVSSEVSREVKRFDSHKPDCSCENDI